jgi:hypothetical protein
MWFPNIALLSAQYRTYALDTIGDIGLSVNRRKLTGLDDYIQWLDEVLAVLVSEGPLRPGGNFLWGRPGR